MFGFGSSLHAACLLIRCVVHGALAGELTCEIHKNSNGKEPYSSSRPAKLINVVDEHSTRDPLRGICMHARMEGKFERAYALSRIEVYIPTAYRVNV